MKDNYCNPKRSFLQADVTGQHVWLNPPFHNATDYLAHFEKCRQAAPSTTSAVIVLPAWSKPEWEPYLKKYLLLHQYHVGRHALFSALRDNGELEWVGPTRFPINVWLADYTADSRETSTNPRSQGGEKRQPAPVPESTLMHVTSQQAEDDLLVAEAVVSGRKVQALLDTEATTNFMDAAFAKSLSLHEEPVGKCRVRMADGRVSRASGTTKASIELGGKKYEVTFTLLDLSPDRPVILGCQWLRQANPSVDWVSGRIVIDGRDISVKTEARAATLKTLDAKRMAKLLRKEAQGASQAQPRRAHLLLRCKSTGVEGLG